MLCVVRCTLMTICRFCRVGIEIKFFITYYVVHDVLRATRVLVCGTRGTHIESLDDWYH